MVQTTDNNINNISRNLKDELEYKLNTFEQLLNDKHDIEIDINNIIQLKDQVGTMFFINETNIDDQPISYTININKLSGCIDVPKLLLKLANLKLSKINDEIQKLLDFKNFEQLIDIKNKYFELLNQISNKYPHETRHQTAIRYIQKEDIGNGFKDANYKK